MKEVSRSELQEFLLEALRELITEVKEAGNSITETAAQHVHHGDTVLTYGYSPLVLGLLLQAVAANIEFSVIVLVGSPSTEVHTHTLTQRDTDTSSHTQAALMADKLAKSGVPVMLAPERASFTLLGSARVSTVLIECDTAFTDGGLRGAAGLHRVCLDARARAVPVLVCLPSFRLSPLLTADCEERLLVEDRNEEVCVAYQHDVLPHALVTALVTNIGALHPAQLMAIARDCFCVDDVRDFLSAV